MHDRATRGIRAVLAVRTGRSGLALLGLVLLWLSVGGGAARAFAPSSGDVPSLCVAAAQRAARATGVPLQVLMAISLTESGRKAEGRFAPWPWTLNIAGKGFFLPDRQAALDLARRTLAGGQTSFDLGCFQVNYRWHNSAFESVEDMLDPDRNALYAAEFLAGLFAESGNWSVAAGHYHSRTPENASRYRQIFDRHFASLGGDPMSVMAAPDDDGMPAVTRSRAPRDNQFPLLQAGGAPLAMGSLVPVQPGRGGLFAGAARSLWGG